jgi:hypothetical protein
MSGDGFERINGLMRIYRKTNDLFAAFKLGILGKLFPEKSNPEELGFSYKQVIDLTESSKIINGIINIKS